MPALPAAAEPARIDALDGLRGIAILLVVLFHALFFDPGLIGSGPPGDSLYLRVVTLGWCGVDVFFVLSGFLITGILLRARGCPRYFTTFYARRALRIFPLYYVVVVALLFVLDRPPATAAEKASYLLYYQNVRFALFGELQFDPARLVTWSLAIEEQFYLVWPAVVWWCGRRTLVRICAIAIVLSIALRLWLLAEGLQTTHFLTPCRLDALATGALVALVGTPPRIAGWVAAVVGAAGLLIVTATTGQPWPESIGMQRYGLLAALVFAAGLFVTVRAGGWPAWVCRVGPLRSLGRYSYCIYLVHFLVVEWLARSAAELSPPTKQWLVAHGSPLAIQIVFALVALLASWGIGFVSWHAFEKWFLACKRFFPSVGEGGAAAGAGSVSRPTGGGE